MLSMLIRVRNYLIIAPFCYTVIAMAVDSHCDNLKTLLTLHLYMVMQPWQSHYQRTL